MELTQAAFDALVDARLAEVMADPIRRANVERSICDIHFSRGVDLDFRWMIEADVAMEIGMTAIVDEGKVS